MTSAGVRQDLLRGVWGLDETSYNVRHGIYTKIEAGWRMAHACAYSELYDTN